LEVSGAFEVSGALEVSGFADCSVFGEVEGVAVLVVPQPAKAAIIIIAARITANVFFIVLFLQN